MPNLITRNKGVAIKVGKAKSVGRFMAMAMAMITGNPNEPKWIKEKREEAFIAEFGSILGLLEPEIVGPFVSRETRRVIALLNRLVDSQDAHRIELPFGRTQNNYLIVFQNGISAHLVVFDDMHKFVDGQSYISLEGLILEQNTEVAAIREVFGFFAKIFQQTPKGKVASK